jgi:GNAT superfamily N-acetyltransferase
VFADMDFARRLEDQHRVFWTGLAPGVRKAGLVEGEPFLDLGDSVAFFAGEGSPLTQANGFFPAGHIEAIQDFYRGRTADWEAVLTPFAGREALQRFLDRGASVDGWETTMYRDLREPLQRWETPPGMSIVEVDSGDLTFWSEISMRGFFGDEPTEVGIALARVMECRENARRYLAFVDGQPAAAATLTTGEIGFLGGAATLPAFRGRGIQLALLRRRLEDARELSEIAVVGASPGTASQRNSERAGFRVAFTQLSLRVPVA